MNRTYFPNEQSEQELDKATQDRHMQELTFFEQRETPTSTKRDDDYLVSFWDVDENKEELRFKAKSNFHAIRMMFRHFEALPLEKRALVNYITIKCEGYKVFDINR